MFRLLTGLASKKPDTKRKSLVPAALSVFLVLLVFCLFSCKKEVVVFKATESTVKEVVDERVKDKKWEKEIESPKDYVLTLSEISAPLPAGCLAVLPSGNIYPEYKDFGSLDTSRLEYQLLSMLDEFFNKAAFARKEKRVVEAKYLDPSYPFLPYVMQPYFDNLPVVGDIIYGKPSFLDNCIEIPARLIGENKHIDLLIYVLKDKEVWYIEQVVFGEQVNE